MPDLMSENLPTYLPMKESSVTKEGLGRYV